MIDGGAQRPIVGQPQLAVPPPHLRNRVGSRLATQASLLPHRSAESQLKVQHEGSVQSIARFPSRTRDGSAAGSWWKAESEAVNERSLFIRGFLRFPLFQ